jgi:outer membrane murein-binding lipoprotein Lpp
MIVTYCRAIALAVSVCVLVGCSRNADKPQAVTPQASTKPDDVAAERAKLSPDDRALVEAQEWCAISTDERLGSMGPPLKLDIKGQTVFICCKGCKKKAEDNPDRTLAKVEELKAKAKAEREAKK